MPRLMDDLGQQGNSGQDQPGATGAAGATDPAAAAAAAAGGAPAGSPGGQGRQGGDGEADPWTIDFNGEQLAIPENFRGDEPGSVNSGAALKSAMDLTRLNRELNESRQVPDEYEIKLSDDLAPKIEAMGGIDIENPLLVNYQKMAKEKGFTQEQFQSGIDLYFADQLDNGDSRSEEQIQSENNSAIIAAIPNWEAGRKGELTAFMNSAFGQYFANEDPAAGKVDPVATELRLMNETPEGVIILNRLFEMTGEKSIPGAGHGDGSGYVTHADLEKLQASEAYRKGDPAAQKKAEEMAKALTRGK